MPRLKDALSAPGLAAIAEFKRRSPSAGDINPAADPARHARSIVALMYGMGLRRLGTGGEDASGVADGLLTLVRGAAR